MKTDSILKINDTSFGYMNGPQFISVISNVSFKIKTGQFIVLEGPNGCGKSTIIKALLKTGACFKGDISLNVSKEEIGYIPQESGLHKSAPVTVSDVVRSAFPFKNVSHERILTALYSVGLENKDKIRYGALSGGQRRRVLLARTLIHDARLVILDEPTANIDRETEITLEDLLYKLIESKSISVLATTHAVHWATKATRISLTDRRNK